ncbi:MAG: prepilin peptidase [Symbiobacteriia bacterium]
MDIIVIPLGLVLGSFYSVVGYRLPRGESLAAPPSHCPQCGHRLGAFELVPVLSFLGLRGHCRHCGLAISWQYPLVEVLTGLLFWLGYRWFGLTVGTPLFWLGASMVIVAGLMFFNRARTEAGGCHDEGGFTLIETLAALAVLSIVVVSVMGLYVASARAEQQATALSEATTLGESVLEGVHYMAAAGVLQAPPTWLQDLPVQRNGVTYRLRLSVEPEPVSPTLARVTVHVSWDRPRPSSQDMVTLVSSAVQITGPRGGGGAGDGDGDGNGKGDGDNGNHYGNSDGSPDKNGDKNGDNEKGDSSAAGDPWAWAALLAQ